MNEQPVVRLAGVDKVFGRGDGQATTTALEAIDLDIRRGEFVSLIGPSGCGKSTLLRIIGDLIRPTRGEVVVNGKPADRARRDRDYGMVFQAPVLFEWRTVEENVKLPLERLALARCSTSSSWATSSSTTRTSCPVACSSESRSPAPSRSNRRFCSWTNRSERSTR
jgi:NitT/TauT family transport system ATP-binding protein